MDGIETADAIIAYIQANRRAINSTRKGELVFHIIAWRFASSELTQETKPDEPLFVSKEDDLHS